MVRESKRLDVRPDIWRAAYRDGESWLTSAAEPFWGRTTKRPQHPGDPLRRTERAIGGSPRSIFQIGGAGAVGTGSIRGMRVLHELAEAGFTIWPFESAGWSHFVVMRQRPAFRAHAKWCVLPVSSNCVISIAPTDSADLNAG